MLPPVHATIDGTEKHTALLDEAEAVCDPGRTMLVVYEPIETGMNKCLEKSLFRSGVHAESPPSITLLDKVSSILLPC